jgi:hypothetical protein
MWNHGAFSWIVRVLICQITDKVYRILSSLQKNIVFDTRKLKTYVMWVTNLLPQIHWLRRAGFAYLARPASLASRQWPLNDQ